MDIRHGYDGRLYTQVRFLVCEATFKQSLVLGCEINEVSYAHQADNFGGTVTIFGRHRGVHELIANGFLELRETNRRAPSTINSPLL